MIPGNVWAMLWAAPILRSAIRRIRRVLLLAGTGSRITDPQLYGENAALAKA
jgi:hypothetical protein